MKRVLLIAIPVSMVLLLVLTVPAQALDRLIMKDGSVVEGKIFKTRFLQVFIETADGNKTIPLSDVERIERGVQNGTAPVTPADPEVPDSEWAVKVRPSPKNKLKNTTRSYNDVIMIKDGKFSTQAITSYGFKPVEYQAKAKDGKILITAEVIHEKHGRNVYKLELQDNTVKGTLGWSKTGEDGKPKNALFTIIGSKKDMEAKPAPKTVPKPQKKSEPTAKEIAAAEKAYSTLRNEITAGIRKEGVEIAIPWDTLSPKQFYELAQKYSKSKKTLAAYRRGHGL